MFNLKRIFALTKKELVTLLHDPKGRMVLIIPPLLQLFIFSFAATLEVKNINIAVYDNDKAQHSYELIERFKASPSFKKIIFINSSKELKDVIDHQKAIASINFPQGFSRNIEKNTGANIQIIFDGRKSNSAQIVSSYLNQVIENYASEITIKSSPAINIVTRNWFNENLIYLWFTLPSLVAILSMLITLIITSLSVARERELGTFDQLLVSPLKPVEILIGKTLPAVMIGLLEGIFMTCAAVFIFKVPFEGSLPLFLIALIIFIFSVIGVGLFISAISKTQQQATLGTFLFMVPAVTLSGYAAPIENMPSWLQPLTELNPLKHFLIISKGIFLKNMPVDLVLSNSVPLVLIGFVTLALASSFFAKKLD